MSLLEPAYAMARDPLPHSSRPKNKSYTDLKRRATYQPFSSVPAAPTSTHCRQDSFDDLVYREFYQPIEEQRQQQQQGHQVKPIMESPKNMDVAATTNTTTSPPPLPRRNALRSASRSSSQLLDSVNLKLSLDQSSTAKEQQQERQQPTPHDVYLSSEEDASSSADDFSDFEWESGSEFEYADDEASAVESRGASSVESSANSSPSCTQPQPRRRSHEITARVVSVVYAGRPAIVQVGNTRQRASSADAKRLTVVTSSSTTSSSEGPTSPLTPTRRRIASAANSFVRRLSISSTTSFSMSPMTTSPPRPASRQLQQTPSPTKSAKTMLSSLLVSKRQQQPVFLNVDPFANGSTYSLPVNPAAADETKTSPTTKLRELSSRSTQLLKKRSRTTLGNFLSSAREAGGRVEAVAEVSSSREQSRSNTPPPMPPAERPATAMEFARSSTMPVLPAVGRWSARRRSMKVTMV